MLTIVLPVIRPWTCEAVIAAIHDSDIPRDRALLVLDAPGCEMWEPALISLGFLTTIHATGNPYPPEDRLERRPRARAMQRLLQTLVPDGPLLMLEDDILVPPDIYARLSAVGPHVTGVQVARHAVRIPVIYGHAPEPGTGVEEVAGCGFGCLLTTGEAYKAATIGDGHGPVCKEVTAQLRPLRVDWGCVCGHMTTEGVLRP